MGSQEKQMTPSSNKGAGVRSDSNLTSGLKSYRYTQLVLQNPTLSAASVSAAVMTF